MTVDVSTNVLMVTDSSAILIHIMTKTIRNKPTNLWWASGRCRCCQGFLNCITVPCWTIYITKLYCSTWSYGVRICVAACQLVKVIVAGSCPLPTQRFLPCSTGQCLNSGTFKGCSPLFEDPFMISTAFTFSISADEVECHQACLDESDCGAYRFVAKTGYTYPNSVQL